MRPSGLRYCQVAQCVFRETLMNCCSSLFSFTRCRSLRGLGTLNVESGPDRSRIEESRFEDGRLPESTAHCSPKNGTPELLSICIKERSYAQPESDKLMTQAMSNSEEYLDIRKNHVTGIDNTVVIAPNAVRTVSTSQVQSCVIAVTRRMGHGEFAGAFMNGLRFSHER